MISKIQSQAQKLNELTKYKSLCEKRLKQLNPIEELSISEESLTNNFYFYFWVFLFFVHSFYLFLNKIFI